MTNQTNTDKPAKTGSSFGRDLSTPLGRLAAHLVFQFGDHAFLRILWSNLAPVAPGVWRSNQPSPRRIARYKAMGIKHILSLRGFKDNPHTLLEREACEKHGLSLTLVAIHARKAVPAEKLLALLDTLEAMPKPFLMHCKSGADRAGLASAFYLMHVEGRSLDEARAQLSLRFLHLKSTKTGILDEILDCYGRDSAETPMPLREWIETRYDPEAITASFARRRGKA